jgi:hypothetical protein
MQITFEVESHPVVFNFDKFWGRLFITVDGNSVVDTVQFMSVSLVKSWHFDVAGHHVQIDKHRAAVFPAFQPQPVYAYVDGVAVAQGVA